MLIAKQPNGSRLLGHIMILSAWGFGIVISSFLFLYFGYRLDKLFDTAPTFMLGLFFLAVFLAVGKLFQDAWTRKNM
jgi:F0F1-type ATP synthase assembly protein I